MRKLQQELKRMQELNKAREYSTGRLLLRMEDTRAVASWLGAQELLQGSVRTPDEVVEATGVEPWKVQRVLELHRASEHKREPPADAGRRPESWRSIWPMAATTSAAPTMPRKRTIFVCAGANCAGCVKPTLSSSSTAFSPTEYARQPAFNLKSAVKIDISFLVRQPALVASAFPLFRRDCSPHPPGNILPGFS